MFAWGGTRLFLERTGVIVTTVFYPSPREGHQVGNDEREYREARYGAQPITETNEWCEARVRRKCCEYTRSLAVIDPVQDVSVL